jgi:hypothetical protein
MSVLFKINFNELYKLDYASEDLLSYSFNPELHNGNQVLLNIKISEKEHPLIPNAFNLSFGPLNSKGKIDDRVELKYDDYSKVFSTILFTGRAYLEANPGRFLGIDGSDNARAYYYYRAIQRNFNYLNDYFNMYGIKYYVRITRLGRTQYENPFDFQDIKALPIQIMKGADMSQDFMYNYFIFNKKR